MTKTHFEVNLAFYSSTAKSVVGTLLGFAAAGRAQPVLLAGQNVWILVLTFMCELDHIAPQETTCTAMLQSTTKATTTGFTEEKGTAKYYWVFYVH